MTRHWYVVSTKNKRETFAQEHLASRGVDSYLPRIMEPTRLGGTTVAPLFPGYLFIHLDLEEQFKDVIWTPGVKKFVGFGPAPAAVDDSVIAFLDERTGPDGVLCVKRQFKKGDVVCINQGPFEGLIGVIESPGSARGRVRVLMEILRRETPVEVPEHIIERISA